ncbi:hypothetical protein GM415_00865 [Pseudodesulfovibrio cashew]|uniref:DUF3592 domain-containing protein n=1 Tax=Pseudodesulfovibrio cashew TaxID=2678688 RepID=A0A6I6JC95_9BACT|nr:DUF3592 domain-containing protein [Pseudodesulfovibrio cashew]QGY38749.1 hypothetical protein GM415_00865 [Pseudodesulfovibrio cashew]
MVYFPGTHPRRTPTQRAVRILIGIAACTLIVLALYAIPYDILREERFRIYGETSTTGVVLETSTEGNAAPEHRFLLRYKYVDQDGIAREATAPLPREAWSRYRPGQPIEVIYIRSRPGYSRIQDEIEPPFQKWLRKALE